MEVPIGSSLIAAAMREEPMTGGRKVPQAVPIWRKAQRMPVDMPKRPLLCMVQRSKAGVCRVPQHL
jgi:hypothetical protein